MSQSPGMSHREHEAAILGTLRRELGETKYDRWLGNAGAAFKPEIQARPTSVVIEVDNAFAARWWKPSSFPNCGWPARNPQRTDTTLAYSCSPRRHRGIDGRLNPSR